MNPLHGGFQCIELEALMKIFKSVRLGPQGLWALAIAARHATISEFFT